MNGNPILGSVSVPNEKANSNTQLIVLALNWKKLTRFRKHRYFDS
jgi:hypothetical protein